MHALKKITMSLAKTGVIMFPALLLFLCAEFYFSRLLRSGPVLLNSKRQAHSPRAMGPYALLANLPAPAGAKIGWRSRMNFEIIPRFPVEKYGDLLLPRASTEFTIERRLPAQNGTEPAWTSKLSTDSLRRRVVPANSGKLAKNFVTFFGCSFTFGLGEDDANTLPNQLSQLLPHTNVYNYALEGGSPAKTLRRFELLPPQTEVPESLGIGIYIFIQDQIRRTVNTMSFIGTWGADTPVYEMNGTANQPKYLGQYQEIFPLKTALFQIFMKSNILRYFRIDFPRKYNDEDYQLVALHLEAVKEKFLENFPNQKFLVVLFPDPFRNLPKLIPELEKYKIHYLDYSDVPLENYVSGLVSYPDGHPTPAAYHFVAQQLAADLQSANWLKRASLPSREVKREESR
jgi:hypothetical protein